MLKRNLFIILLCVVLSLSFSACGNTELPPCDDVVQNYMALVNEGAYHPESDAYLRAAQYTSDGLFPAASTATAESSDGTELQELLNSAWIWDLQGITYDRKTASALLKIYAIDMEKATQYASSRMTSVLTQAVDAATLKSDIYTADGNYLDSVLEAAYHDVLQGLDNEECIRSFDVVLTLKYAKQQWTITDLSAGSVSLEAAINGGSLAVDTEASEFRAAAESGIIFIPKTYVIDEHATSAPVPNPDNFGSTNDPAVITELLKTPQAQALINGQEMSWSPDIEFLPNTQIRYYLDDTILMLQWQECTVKAVGTYAEVIVADASQFRRKLVEDTLGGWSFDVATNLAQQTNAVLASGGDLYNHARACGIVVYDREIYRFEPDTCDTCFVDTKGNLIYGYRGQFTTQEEAEAFIAENDILFSICFGPVLIRDGVDVTPETYAWGEINDTYARSALGMLGDRHYLVMNINCLTPNYYYLATLQNATDAMMAHGVYTAYALDGGQTAEIIVDGEMINPVQFGTERMVSDIIYFGTAIPSFN